MTSTRTTPEAGVDPAGSGVSRALTAAPYVLLGVVLLAVVRGAAVPISNADTFFHLRYGHEFLDGWAPWDPGHLSPYGQQDWLPTQWLSQVLMALADSAFGLAGVAWLTGAAVLATVLTIFVVARKHADPLPAAVVTVVTTLALYANLTGRPQVASYLLLVVVTHVWLQTARDLRPRWWLVPLTWLWVLLHGMWSIGIVIGVVAVLGIVLEQRGRLGELRPQLLRLALVPLLSLVVAGLTPVGPGIYASVLLVGGRGEFHDEWAATSFHTPWALTVAAMIATVLLIWVRGSRAERPGWVPVLMLLLAAAWSAYAVRTVPVAAVMLVPLLAGALQSLLDRRPAPRHERRIIVALTGTSMVLLTLLVPFTSADPARFPSWLDREFSQLPAGTPVQVVGAQGGLLMWRYPDLVPTIDGYSDGYTTRYLRDQGRITDVERGWDTLLEKSDTRHALLPAKSQLAYALSTHEGWRTVGRDDDVVLLEAPEGWGQ